LETKIATHNFPETTSKLAPSYWQYHSNISSSSLCRILVGWNSKKLSLTCIHSAPQWLTCDILQPGSTTPTRITFIYAFNTPAERLTLWNYISHESSLNSDTPWIVMGDFNAIMNAEDRIGGDTRWPRHQDDFSSCIRQSELLQIPYTGLRYSWHNGQHGSNTIQKKIDWIFGNSCMISQWPAAHALFHPRCISDHSLMVLHLHSPRHQRCTPFKFLNIWAQRDDFLDIVSSSWQTHVTGNPMYQFTTKLSLLKSVLKQLHH
jgi:hypothetical protein